MMPHCDITICDRINFLIDDRNLTAAEFARRTHIPYKAVNRYRNYISGPSTANLKKISVGMNVSADWLLGIKE